MLRPRFRLSCRPTVRDALVDLLAGLPLPLDERHPTRVVRAAMSRAPATEAGRDLVDVPTLERLFALYDRHAFDDLLSAALPDGSPGTPLFRISTRMTRTAGKTTCRQVRRSPLTMRRTASIEVAISAPLLRAPIEPGTGVVVSGLRCDNQLDALQRVFEHELVHVLMFCLGWDARCSRSPFRDVAHGLFGHVESKHRIDLAPPVAAAGAPAIRPGDRVRFEFRGTRHEGIVNRITKRATVLVADPGGRRYSDGGRYRKYYVPLPQLVKVA